MANQQPVYFTDALTMQDHLKIKRSSGQPFFHADESKDITTGW